MAPYVNRSQRMNVSMHVLVKGVDRAGVPFDISVASENVSRGGLMFRFEQEVEMGAELDIVVQRPPVGRRELAPLFTRGQVVRVIPATDGSGYDIAVQFTGPHLRTFVKETAP